MDINPSWKEKVNWWFNLELILNSLYLWGRVDHVRKINISKLSCVSLKMGL